MSAAKTAAAEPMCKTCNGLGYTDSGDPETGATHLDYPCPDCAPSPVNGAGRLTHDQVADLWEDHKLPPCNTYEQAAFARAILACAAPGQAAVVQAPTFTDSPLGKFLAEEAAELDLDEVVAVADLELCLRMMVDDGVLPRVYADRIRQYSADLATPKAGSRS